MAQITITIPDGVVPRVLDAVALIYKYNPDLHGTKAQFAKAQIIEWAKNAVKQAEGVAARRVAQQAARDAVDAEIVIT